MVDTNAMREVAENVRFALNQTTVSTFINLLFERREKMLDMMSELEPTLQQAIPKQLEDYHCVAVLPNELLQLQYQLEADDNSLKAELQKDFNFQIMANVLSEVQKHNMLQDVERLASLQKNNFLIQFISDPVYPTGELSAIVVPIRTIMDFAPAGTVPYDDGSIVAVRQYAGIDENQAGIASIVNIISAVYQTWCPVAKMFGINSLHDSKVMSQFVIDHRSEFEEILNISILQTQAWILSRVDTPISLAIPKKYKDRIIYNSVIQNGIMVLGAQILPILTDDEENTGNVVVGLDEMQFAETIQQLEKEADEEVDTEDEDESAE